MMQTAETRAADDTDARPVCDVQSGTFGILTSPGASRPSVGQNALEI